MGLILRPMKEADVLAMKRWPSYHEEFRELDYALRDGGWVDDSFHKFGETVYAAEEGGEFVGFSILSRDALDMYQAEFSIALHPDKVGQGLGKALAFKTLEIAFFEWGLVSVFLIVRRTNLRALRLYEYFGFEVVGQTQRMIAGKPVDLWEMVLSRPDFENRWVLARLQPETRLPSFVCS